MKHVFVINSHTTFMTAMGVINFKKILHRDVVLIYTRNYVNSIKDEDLLSVDLSHECEFCNLEAYKSRRGLKKSITLIDDWINSFIHEPFELYFPLFRHPLRLRYLLKNVRKDDRLEWMENPMTTDAELEKDADFWVRCWNREFKINIPSLNISDKNREDIQQNIRLMKEMIVFCKLQNLQPVIVILPVTKHLSSRFSEDYLQTHVFRYINESAEVGAPVLNYLKDERFTSPEWYINSFFFNKRGREYFSKVFVDDLKSKGLI